MIDSQPDSDQHTSIQITLPHALQTLTPKQIIRLDEALSALGSFGEVHVVKAKGKLRFLHIVESEELPR